MLMYMCTHYRNAGMLLEEALANSLSQITSTVGIDNTVPLSALGTQLINLFPILLVSSGKHEVLINCHELIMSGDSFEKLLLLDQKQKAPAINISSTSSKVDRGAIPGNSSEGSTSVLGRPSLVSKFPEIVQCSTSFIKANGFKAHERRREGVGKVGVSLREIRDHLMASIPNLKSHGISLNSVARLMEPPQRGTIASRRYKGFVAARVPGKRNQYREDHQDQHYLFAQVAYRREFSSMFDKECAIFSADDMNKIKVGALAVSRYHQVDRYFPIEDSPNVPDHDFPIPGYLIIPSGYMRLMNEQFTSTLLEGEDMSEFRDVGINDVCEVTRETTAPPRFSVQTSLTTVNLAQPTSTSSKASVPVSTKITTTMENTSISIQIENRDITHENQPTTLTVEVCSETASHIVSLSSVPRSYPGSTSQLVTDSLRRPHFKTPHTGPATIALRSALFHSSTSETHTTDLKPALEAVVQEGKTMITIIVDGGPDWSTASLLNALYYIRLWKSCN